MVLLDQFRVLFVNHCLLAEGEGLSHQFILDVELSSFHHFDTIFDLKPVQTWTLEFVIKSCKAWLVDCEYSLNFVHPELFIAEGLPL